MAPFLTLLPLDVFRALIVLIPAVALAYQFTKNVLVIKRWVGALFAFIWQFQWRLILFAGGVQLDLWHFDTNQVLLYGVPVDIMFGASLLLGALPVVLSYRVADKKTWLRVFIPLLVIADIVLVFLFLPQLINKNNIAVLILLSILVVAPSQLLAQWTAQSERLYLRSILQNTNWAILLLWLFPSVLFELSTAFKLSSNSWGVLLSRNTLTNILYLLPMLIPATLLCDSLYRFAKDGGGTGFPYDAPHQLVTTGVYQYISNPMQLGIVILMMLWGVILSSTLLMLSSPIALALFIVFKNVCNGSCHLGEKDVNWRVYQETTPKWLPLVIRKKLFLNVPTKDHKT